MKPSNHKLTRRLFALAVAAFLVSGWLGPLLVSRDGNTMQTGGYAEAGNRHIVHINSATMLFDRPLLVIERATISIAPPRDGHALSDVEIAAKLNDGSAHLVIDDGKLLFDASGLHAARVATVSDSVASILRSVTDLSFTTISVNDAKVLHRAAASSDDQLMGHVTCEITKPTPAHIQAKGTLERDGVTIPFDVTLNTKASKTASARLPVSVKIASDLLNLSMNGEYVRDDAFKLSAKNVSLSTPHAKQLISWMAGVTVNGNGLEEFRASGPLNWSNQTIAFEGAKFTIDGNQASGGLSISLGGQRPVFDGTLAFDNLELAPYVRAHPSTLAALTQNALDWSRWLIGEPSGESLIRDLDADLRLSATSVTSGGATLGRGAASLTIKDAKLLADLAEIEIDPETQGNARMVIDLSGQTPRYELRGMFEAPDLANITQLMTDRKIVSGAGSLNVDITTSGSTDDVLRQSMSGSATLSMPDGGQVAVDIGSLMAAAEAGGLGWEKVAEGSTSVNKLDAKLEAANGILSATAVEAETETRSLQVDGTIDLSKQMINLSVATSPKDGAEAPNERIRIRGPLFAPAIKSELPSKAALNVPN